MRLVTISGIVVLFGLMGCYTHEKNGHTNLVNEAMAMKYFEAAIKPDFETMEEFLSEDFKQLGPAVKDSVDRAAHIANWHKSWEEEFNSITYDRFGILSTTVAEGRVAGDWVLDWGKLTINYKNGRPSFTVWFHAALRVKDGKINRQRNFYDTGDVMSQQGFTFEPPKEEGKK